MREPLLLKVLCFACFALRHNKHLGEGTGGRQIAADLGHVQRDMVWRGPGGAPVQPLAIALRPLTGLLCTA